MSRVSVVERTTGETDIHLEIGLDGAGTHGISTGIPFFDHMLTLFAVHGFFDLTVRAKGDVDVDLHHTVEDVGLALGEAIDRALGDRTGIRRYGHAAVPMDETLTSVTLDLSRRPLLVYHVPETLAGGGPMDVFLAKEFFRAVANRAGVTLHVNTAYGENLHHIVESIFKGFGRALAEAVGRDERVRGARSSKGVL
ncbi:MAG: imidazoleglycerol-phosphate dehydratase HisB [Desulfococcaceae bacterium]